MNSKIETLFLQAFTTAVAVHEPIARSIACCGCTGGREDDQHDVCKLERHEGMEVYFGELITIVM